MAKEGATRRSARNEETDASPVISHVEYRSIAALAETEAKNPLLAWAMAMKKRVQERKSDRWQGVAYGPMQPVDPDEEQMSIDKH